MLRDSQLLKNLHEAYPKDADAVAIANIVLICLRHHDRRSSLESKLLTTLIDALSTAPLSDDVQAVLDDVILQRDSLAFLRGRNREAPKPMIDYGPSEQ